MNLFDLPQMLPAGEELSQCLAEGKSWRVERIISTGQKSPDGFWYEQEEDEWVCLLRGKAAIGYKNGETISLSAGDTLLLPAGKKHRVLYTSKTPPALWLCFFAAP